MRCRRLAPVCCALLALAWLLLGVAPAQAVDGEPVDRVLATVDEDPILQSDLQQLIEFAFVSKESEEDDRDFERRVLDLAIEERLRFHEIDRFGSSFVPQEMVEAQVAELRSSFPSDVAWNKALEATDLDRDGVKELVARQLMILIYIEERLGPRVFVTVEDIQEYYEATLVPQLKERKAEVPALAKVREQVRAVLKEQRLNEEIVKWTEELRSDADVVNYFDSEHSGLPPVVQ